MLLHCHAITLVTPSDAVLPNAVRGRRCVLVIECGVEARDKPAVPVHRPVPRATTEEAFPPAPDGLTGTSAPVEATCRADTRKRGRGNTGFGGFTRTRCPRLDARSRPSMGYHGSRFIPAGAGVPAPQRRSLRRTRVHARFCARTLIVFSRVIQPCGSFPHWRESDPAASRVVSESPLLRACAGVVSDLHFRSAPGFVRSGHR